MLRILLVRCYKQDLSKITKGCSTIFITFQGPWEQEYLEIYQSNSPRQRQKLLFSRILNILLSQAKNLSLGNIYERTLKIHNQRPKQSKRIFQTEDSVQKTAKNKNVNQNKFNSIKSNIFIPLFRGKTEATINLNRITFRKKSLNCVKKQEFFCIQIEFLKKSNFRLAGMVLEPGSQELSFFSLVKRILYNVKVVNIQHEQLKIVSFLTKSGKSF